MYVLKGGCQYNPLGYGQEVRPRGLSGTGATPKSLRAGNCAEEQLLLFSQSLSGEQRGPLE